MLPQNFEQDRGTLTKFSLLLKGEHGKGSESEREGEKTRPSPQNWWVGGEKQLFSINPAKS